MASRVPIIRQSGARAEKGAVGLDSMVDRLAMVIASAKPYHQVDADLAETAWFAPVWFSHWPWCSRASRRSVLGWDWLKVIGPPRHFPRYLAIGFLEAFLASYFVVLTAVVLAVVILGGVVWRSRSRSKAARWLLLCGSIVLGLVFAEAAAAVWLSLDSPSAGLATSIRQASPPGDEILIVVIGESSALGVPYDGWLSVGTIVGRELQKAIPAHRFRVEILAEKGATLEAMHLKLASLTERPDALVIFSGHNEFLARFSLANRVAYYFDESVILASARAWLERAGRFSPLYTLVRENLEKHRVSVIPARSLGAMETIVGRPVCTPDASQCGSGGLSPASRGDRRRLRADRLPADLDHSTRQRCLEPQPIVRQPIDRCRHAARARPPLDGDPLDRGTRPRPSDRGLPRGHRRAADARLGPLPAGAAAAFGRIVRGGQPPLYSRSRS